MEKFGNWKFGKTVKSQKKWKYGKKFGNLKKKIWKFENCELVIGKQTKHK